MSKEFKLDFNSLDLDVSSNFRNPLEDTINEARKVQMQHLAAVEAMHREKERESKRQFERLIETIRNSEGNINIYGDASNLQIQQNSLNSSQQMTIETEFDYVRVAEILMEIQSYTMLPQFEKAYGSNAENIKELISETILAVQEKEEPSLIKKALHTLKELSVGAGGSLIASGILSLLGSIPVT